jgi:hypothetical protein
VKHYTKKPAEWVLYVYFPSLMEIPAESRLTVLQGTPELTEMQGENPIQLL